MFDVDETGILLSDVGDNRSGSCSIDLKFDIGKCNVDEEVFFTGIFAYALSRFVGNDKVFFNVIDANSNTMPLLIDCKNQNIASFLANTLESIKYYEKNPIDATSNIIFNCQKNEIDAEDFNANIIKKGNDFLLKINYSQNYSKNTIERFLNSFKLIAHDFLKVNELKDVTYTTSADLNILNSYNQTEHPLKYNDVLDAFNDNLASNPENILVSFEDRSYNYGESAFIADKIAKRLIDLGVNSQEHVAFLTERSELYLFNILSILSVGAIYVPLENKLPDERIELILDDTSSKVLIVSDETYERAKSLSANAIILNISSILKNEIGIRSSLDISYGNVACVLYTSGTTGLPKGVNITRKSIVNVCEGYVDKFDFDRDDVYGLFANISFDAGSLAVCQTFYAGACLSIVPDDIRLNVQELNKYFLEHGVTHAMITTQVAKLFMENVEDTSVEVLTVGGEKLGEFESPEDYLLIDGFGPTETFAFISSINNSQKIDSSSIGNLNYNTKAYVLDHELRQVPIGAVGELYIAGYQVADGYLNREDKTAEAFLTNPFEDDEDYSVLYRTGDMVRILPDGSLGIVGRRDSQVKIRGNRVELSEVESAIREINYIEDVTVQTIKNGNNNELVAYVVPTIEMENIDEVIRKYVSISKPDYMIPSHIIVLDSIPVNINGKVDRNSLPKVDLSSLHADYVAPTNIKEKIIVNAFEEVFNQEKFSIYDDFIRMGGDSISAIRVIALLQKNGISCSARDIISYQTPFLIAQNVHDVNQVSYGHVEGEVDLLPIQSYFFDKIGANEYSQEYILKSKMKLNVDILQKAFDEVSKTHDMLRATFNHEDGRIIQEILPVNTRVCEINEIDIGDEEDLNEAIGKILFESNKNLDIADNLIKINLVHYGGTSYLIFVIHHLIIDGISWSILIDDLTYFYTLFLENKEGNLAIPYPYKSWVHDVEQLASNISESEKQHWIEVNNRLDDSLIEGKSVVFAFNVETSFSADNFLMLSEEEYLALSIARAYKKTYNEDIIFNKESYGRDESIANVNRTIGWFTSQFPVPVSVNAGYDNVSLVRDIYSLKVAFKDVKNLGINYGSLVYGTHELEFKHCPVTLNFLSGEFVFRNEIFTSLDEYLSSDKKVDLRIFESVTYGISIKISRVENDYVVTGSYAEGTYIGDKYEDFIENIKHELEFISNYKFEDDNIVSFLSEAQLGIYLDEKVRSLGTAYSTKGTFKFKPNTTLDEIKKVIKCLVDKHPILKGRVVEGDVPLLVCDSYPVIEIAKTDDYSSLIKPFNLDEYLARFYILEDSGGKSIFYDIHHMICDRTSHHIIKEELNDIVEGNFNEFPDFGFVYDANNNFESRFKNIYEEAQEFYRENLSDIDEVNTVLFDAEGSDNRIRLPIHGIKNSVKTFCHEKGITIGNLLNAVFAYTYSRFTGGDKVFYTHTQHGRHEPYAQKAIGMFARTVPIIVDCSNSSIEDYLANVSDLILNSMKYSIYPYRLLANEFDLNLNGTFEYNYDLNDVFDVGNDIIVEDMEIDLISDFLCAVNDLDDGYLVRVDSCDKYSDELIIRFVNAFKEILIQIISKNELKDIEYTSKEDLEILDAANRTECPLDYDDILDAFNVNLARCPNNSLVSYNDKVYSYAEGAFIADKIASVLKEFGVKFQDNIAFLTERSELYMFSVLGILSCGAACVPLDDNLPDGRVKFILDDTQSKVVIVSDETYERVDSLVDDTIILNISDIVGGDIGTVSSLNTQCGDLACILYTSGTTGIPKGVKIVRKAIINLSSFYAKNYNLTNDDIFGLFSSIGFDAAFKAIFAAVYAGACLDIIPSEVKLDMHALNNHFIRRGINHVDITTQVAKLLISHVEDVSLDVLFTGGEKLGEFDEETGCRFVDGYGPAEAYVEVATVDVADRIDSSSVGHLIDNIKAYILDDEFRRVPIGAVGELYLAGSQIAEGYLNRQEETDKAFMDNPFDDDEMYSTLYRTGDMVRLLPDNSLGVVGRRDGQVKIRGNRVELSEVESIIRELDYIEDVTVQTIKYRGNYEIVAYVVVCKEIDNLEAYVCDYIGESKPDYMIPSFVIGMDEIPLSVNGKVDRYALPEVNPASLRSEYVAPTTDNERKIVKSFESVFNQNEIGIYDDFVRLGGDSIAAIRIISLLKKEGIECSARDILAYKSPYLISQNIAEAKKIIYDPVEGKVDLHPIQRFFFEEIDSNNYSQEFVLKSEIGIELDILQRAFDGLSDIHDMLRATYCRDGDNIIQEILPVGTSVCEIKEAFIEDDFDNSLRNIISESNKALDINGGLIKITLVRHADECFIVFVIHHLIIDGVSWSILIDDLTHIYKLIEENREIDILRPYPFKLWVDDLKKSVSNISSVEKQHWLEVDKMWDDSKIKGRSKVFALNIRCSYDAENQLRLTEEEYFALGIARAYKKTYGKDIIFNRESYGRDESIADVSRTIGWFTSQFPVPVKINCEYDDISLIKDVFSIKKAFKNIKYLGLNYASLVYMTHDLKYKHCPVTFNFLSAEFLFKNEIFQSIDGFLATGEEIKFDNFDGISYGITFNVSRLNDIYLINGDYAEGTYLEEKFDDFVKNVEYELEFLSQSQIDNIACPLSESQLGIYLDEKVNDMGTAYSASGIFKCTSDNSIKEIEDAIHALIKKHPILKGRIVDGEIPLIVCDSYPSIEVVNTGDFSTLIKPFDLDKFLTRFFIIENDAGKFIFYDSHHIISDGVTCALIPQEFKDFFEGNFDDSIDVGFAIDSFNSFESKFKPTYEHAHDFYKSVLSDVNEVNTLLFDGGGSNNIIKLPIRGIKNKIEEFSYENDITVGNLLNAVFAYTYSRFTGGNKVYYASNNHGRHSRDLQNAWGMFVRTIPVIVDCSNTSVKEYLRNVSDLMMDSIKYGDYPYRLLANEFDLKIDVAFEYNFSLDATADDVDDLTIEEMPIDLISDFVCVVNDLDDGYLIRIQSCDRYSDAFIIRFLNVFKEVLIQISDKRYLSDIEYISSEDIKLLDSYNQTKHDLNYGDVLDAFNDNLAQYPSSSLVEYRDKSYSYTEGAFIADGIAKNLKDLGVVKQNHVAFLVERSELYLLNALAIMSIGAVYVPLDAALPDERIRFMISDTDSSVVIVSDETYERAKNLTDSVLLNVSDIMKGEIGKLTTFDVDYGNLACILYTSGTTGIPKGVKITRKAILNASASYVDRYGIGRGDVYGLYAAIGCDVASLALCQVLYSGACLSIVPMDIKLNLNELNDYFSNHNVSYTAITAQVAKLFMSDPTNGDSLKVLSVGGEMLGDIKNPDNYLLMDEYGPTEAFAFVSSINNSDKIDFSSVGSLNYNTKLYILDTEKRRVPYGAVGELCLAGYQIADGYLNREDETATAFLDNEFDRDDDYDILYRTGDMVRLLPDGSIGVVGRRDGQVKIRGNRVELSEVEGIIREIDYVEDVTVQSIKIGSNYELAAYIVTKSVVDDFQKDVCEFIARKKPEFMVPAFVIRLDYIPLTVNGKVDKGALPKVNLDCLRDEYVAPRNEIEKIIVEAFEIVFNLEKISIYDDFLKLGGNSLNAIKLSSHITNYNITAADILSSRTPQAIAENIGDTSLDLDIYSLDYGCPLNESQLNVFLDIMANNKVDSYLIPFNMNISKRYGLNELLVALDEMLRVHPILSMCVSDEFEVPYLIKGSKPQITVESDADDEFIMKFLTKPHNLKESLCRFLIIENKDDYSLFAVFNHIVFDALSNNVFKHDLSSILEGELLDIDDSFLKIAAFNQQIDETQEYIEAHNFYESMLADIDEVGELDDMGSGDSGVSIMNLDLDIPLFKSFLEKSGVSENVVFTGVFAYTLSRFAGSDKVSFNIIDNGRDRFKNLNAIGMFVNTLPLLVDCKNQEISSFMDYMSSLVYNSMKYNYYPFRALANRYGVDSSILFQYMPEWIGNFEEDVSNEFPSDDVLIKNSNDFITDLSVDIIKNGESYSLNIMHSDKYSEEMIQRLVETYELILHDLIKVNKLEEINYLSKSDLEILEGYNKTEHPLIHDDILDEFNDNLAECPDNNLVSYNDVVYSYGEGAFIADRISKNLKDLGVGKENHVAFLVERSELYLLNALAIMSIGAVYVPLDDALPDERIRFMISDTDSSVVIVSDETYERAKNLTDSVLLNVSDIMNGEIGKLTTLDVDYGDIACILYTSGTTGIPKGVKITRKAIVNLVTVYQDKYRITNDDVYGLFSTIGFDAALLAMMVVLFSGACLSIVPDNVRLDINALNNYFIQHNITHTLITSQVGRLFIQTIENTSLDVLLVGGEKLGEIESPENYLLVDAFGPTEACVFISSIKNSDKIDPSSIGPIGYNTKAYILDNERRRVPIGATGELYLSGYQIADGYLNRDDENTSVFVTNPFSDDEDYNIMYRSGDMVKLLSDGTLAIVGRRDSQVKIRGNRVELSEVESIISKINFVEEVTVQTIKNGTNNELVAYVVTSEEIENLKDSVCEYVARNKPEYMVPSFVISLDEIPLNINGKVDKRALPDVDLDSLYADYVAPTTQTEKLIVEAFENVFNHEISVLDDFVRLGGDSLTAIKVLSYIGNNNISAADILNLKTPKAIAESIKESNFDLDIYSLESGCPLNEPQLNVYLDIIANDKVDSYLVPFSNVIPKGYDVDDVCGAVNALLDIHPILKMCISEDYDVPYLIKSNKPQILVKDNFDKDVLFEFLTEPFDLYDNLSRFLIVEKEDKIVLFTVLHHLISDALSLYSFKNDLKRVLKGEHVETDDSFLKVSAFNQQIKQTKEYDDAKTFYNTMFMDMDEVIVLSDDVVNETPGICSRELNVDISEFLAKNNVGENVLFTCVFAYTLSRFAGGDKVLFNIVENGRSRFNNYDSIGMFANTLPIIADCKNQNVSSFIEYMSDLIYTVMKYNYYPFRFLANEYNVNSNILFQYFPSWIDLSEDTDYVNEIYGDIVGEMEDVISDLIVQVVQEKDKYNISISYSDKYSPYLIQQLIDSYELILNDIIRVEKLSDINYTAVSDLELLDSYNQTEHSLEYNGIIEAFIDQLSNVPDNIFTISDEISYTYAESAYLVNQLSSLLKENNLDNKDRVAIFVDRNHWVILAALGCLSQAITYIQIDEKYPDQRIAFMIEQSSSNTIITTDTFQSRVNSLIEEFKLDLNVINISHLSDDVKTSSYVDYVDESINEVACIIYTSGTTGTPKAVQMTRWQLVNFMQFYADDANFTNESVQGIFVSIGFDISLEMFVSVFTGGALTFVPYDIRLDIDKLNEYYIKHNVTHTFITTQIAKLFIKNVSETSLRYLRTGGEKLWHIEPPENYTLTDLYGPAEYNAVSTMDIDKKAYESSVGILNWNTKTYILDNEKRRVPFGATGEIYVSGYQTTIGYLDNPEANENVLFSNPFDGEINGYEVMYKTGDIARFLPDGSMGIVGRVDSQVKIRGNRVEISEVEVTIRSLEYIKDVTVQTKVHDGNNELVAYVTITDDFKGDIVNYVQGYLYENKPDYMVPSFVIELDKIPLTVNGKVDKSSLPDVNFDSLYAEYVAPTTDDEKAIVEAFEEVFNQDKIGIHDDFIKLGGDSLIAIKLMSILNKKSINVDVKDILAVRTPQNIAQNINQKEYGFVLSKKGSINQNMFLLPPIGGLSPIFSKLIEKIDFEGNIYTIDDIKYSLSLDELKEMENGNCTLDHYYKAINNVFNDGDILVGYSLGCVFASLLAEKLENDNRTIDKCILIDSDLLFERDHEITTDEVINEFAVDVGNYPDDFIDKFVEVIRINSKLNYNTPNVDTHITFLSTWDSLEDRIVAISSNYDYIVIDSTHKRIINEDIDKIIKYLGF